MCDSLDTRCDVRIGVLWDRYTDAIIDVNISNYDTYSDRFEPMGTLLAWWYKRKKYNHANNCHGKRKHFSPFIISVNVILRREDLSVLANFSHFMAAKMDEPISHVQVWINSQVLIAVMRSYSQIIRWYLLTSPLRDRDPYWYPELGLGLAQYISRHNNSAHTSANNIFPPVWPLLSPPHSLTAHTLHVHEQRQPTVVDRRNILESKSGISSYKSDMG